MNRIDRLFETKNNNILSVYFTAGYPNLNDTKNVLTELVKAGVDLIEVGIPFSDPLADGPTIQKSSEIALENGMSLKLLFDQLKDIRDEVDIPLIMMGYINPVMQYGVGNFCAKCKEIGIDGVILPDLPFEEYEEEYKEIFEKYGLYKIFLVPPQTSNDRIIQIDNASKGFVYLVSSSSTTGAKDKVNNIQIDFFQRVQKLRLKNPQLIGFGISNKDTFASACKHANGGIIGSAFIKALGNPGDIGAKINAFVTSIKG